jgi:hypothetical protein
MLFKASLALLSGALCLCAQETTDKAPAGKVPGAEVQGVPARAAPSDYPSQAKAGPLTIAAEFKGHFVPTPEATFTTEDFVVVEVALFGPEGAKSQLSPDQFSIRINGKKNPSPSQSYLEMMSSLKDPAWEPPASDKGSKTTFNAGGAGNGNDPPPAPVHPPPEVQRAMFLKVQKAAFPEGDRALPRAGLVFFSYHGQSKGIRKIELLYKGPAGQASLDLEP